MAKDSTDVLNSLFFSQKPKPQQAEDAAYREMETSGLCCDHQAPLVESGYRDIGEFKYTVYRCPVTGCSREIYAKPRRK